MAFIFAYSWHWLNILRNQGHISDKVLIWLFACTGILFLLHQLYLIRDKPVEMEEVEKKRPVIELFLRGLLNEYSKKIKAKTGDDIKESVKINIMIPTGNLINKYLNIFYTAPHRYTDKERTLKWKKSQGTCGYTWKNAITSTFDAEHRDYQLAAERLTREQSEIIGHIQSTLSYPIISKKKVIAVLNIDSDKLINETLFDNDDIIHVVGACANNLSPHLFKGGVTKG